MLAPNPNTPRPTRRDPWEMPADLPLATLMPYGHRIALEVGARHIRRAMGAAARAFEGRGAGVYVDGCRFESAADAARFLCRTGAVASSELATARGILRACRTGKPYRGRRWQIEVSATA